MNARDYARRTSVRTVIGVIVAAIAVAACNSARSPREIPLQSSVPVAPWAAATLRRGAVPPVFFTEWRKADNRASCGLIAPAASGAGTGAIPRGATFSGGWAVAYDLGSTRSAFGIAGTGSLAADPSFASWPFNLRYADGSTAGYGPEGQTGPKQLAYLRIRGQRCLYNVWSAISREHLEFLLTQLRFVDLNNR